MPTQYGSTTLRLVRCTACRKIIRFDKGEDSPFSQLLKDFCEDCPIPEEILIESIEWLRPLLEQLGPAKRAANEKQRDCLPLTEADRRAIKVYHQAMDAYDGARMGLANLRLNQREEAESKIDPALETSSHSLAIRGKRARSASPDADAQSHKRMRPDEPGEKGIVEHGKTGRGGKAKRKVSFKEPFDPREIMGYRDSEDYRRGASNAWYEIGEHAASPGFTLVNSSGCSITYEEFYNPLEDEDDEDVVEETDVGEKAAPERNSFLPSDDMSWCSGDGESLDDEDLPNVDLDELVRWHDEDDFDDGVDEGVDVETFEDSVQFQFDGQVGSFEPLLHHNTGIEFDVEDQTTSEDAGHEDDSAYDSLLGDNQSASLMLQAREALKVLHNV